MKLLFTALLNMSLMGSLCVIVVLLARLFLKKAPKGYSYLLWLVVFARLILPIGIPVPTQLQPRQNLQLEQQQVFPVPLPQPTLEADDSGPLITKEPTLIQEENMAKAVIPYDTIWLVGFTVMLLYAIMSYWRLKNKLATATKIQDNVYETDHIDSPFVLGLFRPKVYLPCALYGDKAMVLAHEQAHIRRGDHVVKLLCFLGLALHWFNPLVWVAYFLMERDMELACDELVLKRLGEGEKGQYSMALLSINQGKRLFLPPAFNETGVKSRVKNVLNYKKPAMWFGVLMLFVVCILTLGLMMKPVNTQSLNDLHNIEVEQVDAIRFTMDTDIVSENMEYQIKDIFSQLEEIRISAKEISTKRGVHYEDGEYSVRLHGRADDGNIIAGVFYFNEDFSKIWYDNGIKPTLEFAVQQPEKMEQLFFHAVDNLRMFNQTLMYNGKLYWKSGSELLTVLPEGTEEVGTIQSVAPSMDEAAKDFMATGFDYSIGGSVIYADKVAATLYVHNKDQGVYIPMTQGMALTNDAQRCAELYIEALQDNDFATIDQMTQRKTLQAVPDVGDLTITSITIKDSEIKKDRAWFELELVIENGGNTAFEVGTFPRWLWVKQLKHGWAVEGLMTGGKPDEAWMSGIDE